jgi:hypothetical protein
VFNLSKHPCSGWTGIVNSTIGLQSNLYFLKKGFTVAVFYTSPGTPTLVSASISQYFTINFANATLDNCFSSTSAWPSVQLVTSNISGQPDPGDPIDYYEWDGTAYALVGSSFYEGQVNGNPIINAGSNGQGGVAGYVFGQADPIDPNAVVSYSQTAFCFLTGTHITTPTGEILVEDLSIGDIISTADGGVRKVLWIGKQTLSAVFTPAKHLPVEITIGAFCNNLPSRPLRVSPGHSLLVGGVFPTASALVNDITVRQLTKEELPEIFTYYHIEVEDHALILAEGVPAETFLDASSRRAFSNWSEYVELYGEEEREVTRSDLHYKRILKFATLPQELKETIGYPLSNDEMKVA